MDEALELIEAMKLLVHLGLCNPRGGNASFRLDEDRIVITPSGLAKHRLSVDDLVVYSISKNRSYGKYKPSIELQAHVRSYLMNNNIKAIIHAHPPLSLALTDQGVKEWWNTGLVEVEYSVGKVVVVEPAPPGSIELADNIAKAFAENAKIVVIPKHGVFSQGINVHDALDSIIALEETAKYVLAAYIIRGLGKQLY